MRLRGPWRMIASALNNGFQTRDAELALALVMAT
jgi:hypothetical protein